MRNLRNISLIWKREITVEKKIAKLELANGKHLHKAEEIMKEIENFYRDLYTSNCETEDDCFENFVQTVEIPKLQDLEKEELEGEITLEECKEVLKTFSSGKSPDEDCFTWELYNCFFNLLSEDLINCYNAAYREGEMLISQHRGTITLRLKEDYT